MRRSPDSHSGFRLVLWTWEPAHCATNRNSCPVVFNPRGYQVSRMSRQPSLSQSTIELHGAELIESILAARRPSWALAMPALPEPEARRTPARLSRSRGSSLRPSTSEVSHRKPRPEAEQNDAVALESPEEGKGFRSSWEINVKKLVGDAVGNVNLICDVERSGKLTNKTSLDEYKSYFARYRSCSVRGHFCSYPLCFIDNVIGEEDSS